MNRLSVKPTRILALLCAALALAFMASREAKANDSKTNADARCIVAGAKLAAAEPGQQRGAMMLVLYYIGRIDGRSPKLDLESVLESVAAKVTGTDLQSELRRCGTELATKGREITRIGRDLSKMSK